MIEYPYTRQEAAGFKILKHTAHKKHITAWPLGHFAKQLLTQVIVTVTLLICKWTYVYIHIYIFSVHPYILGIRVVKCFSWSQNLHFLLPVEYFLHLSTPLKIIFKEHNKKLSWLALTQRADFLSYRSDWLCLKWLGGRDRGMILCK